jgi:hypothetical protein
MAKDSLFMTRWMRAIAVPVHPLAIKTPIVDVPLELSPRSRQRARPRELPVVDASITPNDCGANTHLTTVMIGEVADAIA